MVFVFQVNLLKGWNAYMSMMIQGNISFRRFHLPWLSMTLHYNPQFLFSMTFMYLFKKALFSRISRSEIWVGQIPWLSRFSRIHGNPESWYWAASDNISLLKAEIVFKLECLHCATCMAAHVWQTDIRIIFLYWIVEMVLMEYCTKIFMDRTWSESPSDNLFIVLGRNLASKSNSIIIIIMVINGVDSCEWKGLLFAEVSCLLGAAVQCPIQACTKRWI